MGLIGAIWGLCGVCLLLFSAIWRLTPHAIEALGGGLSVSQWVFGMVWLVFMVYSEGWRGFHRGFSPRVVARAARLQEQPDRVAVLLGPLVCLGFLRATSRRRRISIIVFSAICALVFLVRLLPQPWRGLIDLGVVSGLAVGLLSMVYYAALWAGGRPPDFPADYAAAQTRANESTP